MRYVQTLLYHGAKNTLGRSHTAIALLLCFCLPFNTPQCHAVPVNKNAIQSHTLNTLNFANRTLQGILWIYQKENFKIIFSNELVHSSMVQTYNPPNGEPVARLKSILSVFNLALRYEDYTNTWLVVPSDTPYQHLRFTVKDARNQQPIAMVKAFSDGEHIGTSDSEGVLSLHTKSSTQPILLSHPDYAHAQVKPKTLFEGQSVALNEKDFNIEEVIVTASRYTILKSKQASNIRVRGYEADILPTHGGDAIQIINTLPGAASSGVSAKPNIRGGAQDELLILFDGIELSNPFHLKDFYSLISAINTNIVDTINIYTGGYPANYGSKMSGVMDITPVTSSDINNSIDWNFYTTAINLKGTSEEHNLDGVLSMRRGNIDDLLGQINEDIGAPRFNDTYAKIKWQTSPDFAISLGILSLMDDIKFNEYDDAEKLTQLAASEYKSNYFWLKTETSTTTGDPVQWLLATSNIKNNRSGFTDEPNNPVASIGTLRDKRAFQSYRLGYSQAHRFNPKHSLKWGALFEYANGSYDYTAEATLGELATLFGNLRDVDDALILSLHTSEAHVYANHSYSPTDNLQIETGIRLDSQRYLSESEEQLNPRIAMRYSLSPALGLKISAGRFYQAPDIDEIHIGSDQPLFYTPQKSDHYIIGLDYQNKGFYASIESYKKNIFAPKARWENIINPYRLLPELAADRVEVTPDTARATGIELVLAYQPQPNLSTQISYTRSHVEDNINGQDMYRSWDQAHTIQGKFSFASNNWTFASMAKWHSGWRRSSLPASATTLDQPFEWGLNTATLPSYISIDVRASYAWASSHGDIELYLDINNIFNRVNVGYYDIAITPNATDYNLTHEPSQLLPVIPSLGIRWEL